MSNIEAAVKNRMDVEAIQALTTDIEPGVSEEDSTSRTAWIRWDIEDTDYTALTLTDSGRIVETEVFFDVFARNTDSQFGYVAAAAIAAEIITAIQDIHGTFGGIKVRSVRVRERDAVEPEPGAYHRIVESRWQWYR